MPSREYHIVKGNLETIILSMISGERMHGYAIITKIRKQYGVYFGPSTIYPILVEFERQGLLTSNWDLSGAKPHKVYTVTEQGKAALKSLTLTFQLIAIKSGINLSSEVPKTVQ